MMYIVDIKGEIEGDYEIIGNYESEIIKAYVTGFNAGVESIKNERPQGEWKETMNSFHICSLCGKYGNPNFFKFCPNCGADMRKDEDDG